MPIYDQSYKRWEGSFKSHALRWWVISKYGVRTAFKSKIVKRLFVLALLPFPVFALRVYVTTQGAKLSGSFERLFGGRAAEALPGKVYEVEIEGESHAFVRELEQNGISCRTMQKGLAIEVPEGENSKRIRAVAKKTGTKITRLVPPGFKAGFYNEYLKVLFLLQFVLLLAVGTGLISKDVKFNALPIYLAKPIVGIEYILGKLGTLMFFLLMVTFVPGIMLFLLQAIFLGDFLYVLYYWWVPGAILVYSLVITLSGSLIVLALSAFSRNVRSAAFGGIAVFWFSDMVAEILRNSTWNDNYLLISFTKNLTRVGEKIFRLGETMDVRWELSFFIVLGLTVVSAAALVRRVRAVEVVK